MASTTAERQQQKALMVALTHNQWAVCTLRDGSKAFGIPSSSDADLRYITTADTCDCRANRNYGDCKHRRAVRLVARLGLTLDSDAA